MGFVNLQGNINTREIPFRLNGNEALKNLFLIQGLDQ